MVPQRTLIIGAGRIGHALAEVIGRGSSVSEVVLWDKNPQLVPGQLPLGTLASTADVIFCCTPSWTVRDVLTELKLVLPPTTIVITLAKGCEASTGKTMAEVADEILPEQPHGVLGGPMLAETLLSGHRGVGVIGSSAKNLQATVVPLFSDTPVEIQLTADVYGVSLCGCLKNIYAFLVGISAGSDLVTADQQRFFEQAQREFLVCGAALGIAQETLTGPAGIGDFMETATSPASHNYQSGRSFAKQGHLASSSEATISLPAVLRRLKDASSMPLIAALPAMIAGQQPISSLRQLLNP